MSQPSLISPNRNFLKALIAQKVSLINVRYLFLDEDNVS